MLGTDQLQRLGDRDNDLTLLDHYRAICSRWRIIAMLCIVSIFLTFIYTLTLKKLYQAKATILMPKEGGAGSQVSVALGGGGRGSIGGMGGISSLAMQYSPTLNREIFQGVLNSKSLRKEVFKELDKKLGSSAGSKITDVQVVAEKGTATIALTITALDPKIAAIAANLYFETLNQRLIREGSAQMSAQRAFVTDRLALVSKELKDGENALEHFQIENKYIASVDPKAGAAATGGLLRGQLVGAELQLERMRTIATESHPQIIGLKKHIVELKRQMSKSQYGQPMTLPPEEKNLSEFRKEFFVPTVRQPELRFKMLRLYRDVKVHEAVFTLLTQQLESLKLSEALDLPQVQFLDRAKAPGSHFKPRPIWNMSAAAVGSLIVGIFLALLLDYIERVKSLERLREVEARDRIEATSV